MPTDLSVFVKDIQPNKTVLLFGAGSSIPSGAPSVNILQQRFEDRFHVSRKDYNLAEQTGIIEQKIKDRRALIEELQDCFKGLKPSGAILNLPLYEWKSLYSTNYDELVEDSYRRRNRALNTYTTNFDFGLRADPSSTQLFKLHGTISKDISLGDRSRIILTEADYDATEDYRQQLYDRFKSDIGDATLVIIGHSLADPDIKSVINRTLSLVNQYGLQSRIVLLLYTRDEGRSSLFESRGVQVVFGGLDDFFAGLIGRHETAPSSEASSDPLDKITALRPATLDAGHSIKFEAANFSAMYNGWPASYSNIRAGHTFRRTVSDQIVEQFRTTDSFIASIVGPSGVGKTSASRQVLTSLLDHGFTAWEHKADQTFLPGKWREVASILKVQGTNGALFIDDAHAELPSINDLVENLARDKNLHLRIILCSTKYNWGPRIKSHVITRSGVQYDLNKIIGDEVDKLLNLVDSNRTLSNLVEEKFAGYSRPERRRRLTHRCEADMFVCLKNIFSSDRFDDIILREYALLDLNYQDVYKVVAAMENAGVHVHRQLVVRLLGLQPAHVSSILSGLEDIIHETTVDERQGVYAWHGRHKVIMGIVAEHKFYDKTRKYDLFERIIENIRPSYDIEIRTIREICNVETGLATISNVKDQNVLLRKMISIAPGERVPRHRLIRNLIELNDFDAADTEIKAFKSDFRIDAPTARYQIKLSSARATRTPGIMNEDRIALLYKTRDMAAGLVGKFKISNAVIGAYCEVGIEIAKMTGSSDVFDTAISILKRAEEKTGDADMSRAIARMERRMLNIGFELPDIAEEAALE